MSSSFDVKNEKRKITDDEVISLIAEYHYSMYYINLSTGNIAQEGIGDKEQGAHALINFLCFFSGNEEQVKRLFKKSTLYTTEIFDRQVAGGNTYLDSKIKEDLNEYASFAYEQSATTTQLALDKLSGKIITKKIYSLDDTGNAYRFYDTFSDILRYNTIDERFMVYDEATGVWVEDTRDSIRVKKLADKLIGEMREELANASINESGDDDKKKVANAIRDNIKRLASNAGKNAMLKEVQHVKKMPVVWADFDQSETLLNTLSGVVDLKTGVVYPHAPSYMMSQSTNIEIDKDTPPTRWLQFVDETFLGDKEIIEYVQQALGYSLTGSGIEQKYFQCQGEGNNGKSVMFNVVRKCFGDYAYSIPIASISNRKRDSSAPAPDLVPLNRARIAITTEPEESVVIAESFIKQLTGQDPISARSLYSNIQSFVSKAKLWILENGLLQIRGTTRGDWRRVVKINFENNVPENKIDLYLQAKLEEEAPSILRWLISGAVEWYKKGMLKTPDTIKEAVNAYREEMDVIAKFIEDRCFVAPYVSDTALSLFSAYKKRAKEVNENSNITQIAFSKEFMKHAIGANGETLWAKVRNRYGIIYKGICLTEHDTTYTFDLDEIEKTREESREEFKKYDLPKQDDLLYNDED